MPSTRRKQRTTFTVAKVATGHEDMIHDTQLNFLGNKLATCSSDKTVRVFDVDEENNTQRLIVELKGHDGPVWQVAWCDPIFGTLVASCSHDRKVIIWKEVTETTLNGRSVIRWEKNYVYEGHDASVNSVSWAPHEWGQMLACGSSDGCISVLTWVKDRWIPFKIPNAHMLGCNSVSWSPADNHSLEDQAKFKERRAKEGIDYTVTPLNPRFASGGCDNLVKIWRFEQSNEQWVEEAKLEGHADWVREVAWSPAGNISRRRLASCSQDKRVIIWNNRESDGIAWTPEVLNVFKDVVWHVSWNLHGVMLGVTSGKDQVSLWKLKDTDSWECLSKSKTSSTFKKPKATVRRQRQHEEPRPSTSASMH